MGIYGVKMMPSHFRQYFSKKKATLTDGQRGLFFSPVNARAASSAHQGLTDEVVQCDFVDITAHKADIVQLAV